MDQSANWLDPKKDEDVEDARKQAARELIKFPGIASAVRAAAKDLASLRSPISAPNMNGSRGFAAVATAPGSATHHRCHGEPGNLAVVYRTSAAGKIRIDHIRVSERRRRIEPANKECLLEGRPVFVEVAVGPTDSH